MRTIRPVLFAIWIASLAAVAAATLLPWPEAAAGVRALPGAGALLQALAYMWLSALALRVFLGRDAAFTWAWGMILYGAALEVAQALVPGGEPSLGGIGLNLLGVCVGVLVGHRLKVREHDRRMAEVLARRAGHRS